jgi:MFS family permease
MTRELAAEVPATGLWAAERRGLTIGLVLTTTFIAAEALAVITIMPQVARDLGGLSLYGWVFSAFMLGSLVGTVAAGREADRRGPARPYVAGLLLFGSGLAVAGLAPSMSVLVVGRVLQGLGAGAAPAVAYVAIGRSLPERLRARMLAVLSTAWVLPGLLGPVLSAQVARAFGWRVVFLGLIPLVAVAGVLALPTLVRIGRPTETPAAEHRLLDALRVSLGGALVIAALAARGALAVGVLGAVGMCVAVPALRRLLPVGTLAARSGLPATILSRGLLTFAFFGADAFVTLAITTVLHHSTTTASVAITGATLSWTMGAWLQARLSDRWEGRRLIRCGLALVLVGIAGMVLCLRPGVPVVEAILAWSVAGLGMGLAYAPTSLMMLREASSSRTGWASASLNLSDVLGTALGAGLGGAALVAASHRGWSISTGLTIAFSIAGVAAIVALGVSTRLPRYRAGAS